MGPTATHALRLSSTRPEAKRVAQYLAIEMATGRSVTTRLNGRT